MSRLGRAEDEQPDNQVTSTLFFPLLYDGATGTDSTQRRAHRQAKGIRAIGDLCRQRVR